MKESVEDRGGEDVVAEDGSPFGEMLVACDDRGALLVSAADQLEEHVGFVAVEGEVSDLVYDQQRWAHEVRELPGEPVCCVGGFELSNEVVEGGEVDRLSGLAGSDRQPDRDMRFPYSRWSKYRDVPCAGEEFEGGKVSDAARFESGLEGVVEVVEGFVMGKPGEFEGVAEPPGFSDCDFFGEEVVDEVEVSHLRGICAGGGFGDRFGGVTEAEPEGVVDDPLGGQ